MTNEKEMAANAVHGETLFDEAAAKRAHDAWDALSPDEEALARMERTFLAAVEASDAGAASDVPAAEHGTAHGVAAGGGQRKPGRSKRLARWVRLNRHRVAAAAAVAIVLVVGGAVTSMQQEQAAMAPSGVSSSAESAVQDTEQDAVNDGAALTENGAVKNAAQSDSESNSAMRAEEASDADALPDSASTSEKGSSDTSDSAERESYSGDKIIYTASAQVATTDYENARKTLKEKAAAVKATVQNEQETTPYPSGSSAERARPTLTVTYRVPTDSFDAFLDSLSDVGTVTSRTSSADNISQTYSETEARVKSLEIQKKRLEEMLKDAGDIDEMLQIEEQLQDVRSELEFEKNEKSRMDTDVAYSTVTVTLIDMSELPEDESDDSFVAQLGRAAAGAWKWLGKLCAGTVLFAVSVWPLWVVLAVAAVVAHVVRKKRGPKGDATPVAPDGGTEEE